jgi:hypothetical protein
MMPAGLSLMASLYYNNKAVELPFTMHDRGDAQRYTADNDQINRYGAASTGT